MINIDHKVILAAGVVAVVAYFILRNDVLKVKNAAVDTIKSAGEAINPVSEQNIFYRGAGAIVDGVSSDGQKKPLGIRIYDWIHL